MNLRRLVLIAWLSAPPRVVSAQPEVPPSTPDEAAQLAVDPADEREASTGARTPRRWERRGHHRPLRNALLYYPASALGRGFTLGYERAMPDPRFTVLTRGSASFPAGRDFRSVDLELGLEGRYYPFGRGPFSRWSGAAPVGVYAGLRLGWLHARLVDRRDGRLVGTLNRVVTEVSVGFRLTIAGRVELSPFFGALFYADVLAGLPPSLRPSLSTGLTIGVFF